MTSTNLKRTIGMLRAEREELLKQLDAVDAALAALTGTGAPVAIPHDVVAEAPVEAAPALVVATRVKSPRVLTDEHRQALVEGQRKARHSRDAAAGRARELSDPQPRLAPTSSVLLEAPRLVKRDKTLVRSPARAKR